MFAWALLVLLGSTLLVASLSVAPAAALPRDWRVEGDRASPPFVVPAQSFGVPQKQGGQRGRDEGGGGWLDLPSRYLGLFMNGDQPRTERSCSRRGDCPSGTECCCCGDECSCKQECSFRKCR